jgi:hypothetical protein
MKSTRQWQMVCELNRVIKKVPHENQKNFIKGLYENLDEFEDFLSQQTEQQLEYLNDLYKLYIKK